MITEQDIKMIRSGINGNLQTACKLIRWKRLEEAKGYINVAIGMVEALYSCDGGPASFGSIARAERLHAAAMKA